MRFIGCLCVAAVFWGCSPARPAAKSVPGPAPGADSVFEVLEATGSTFVMLGAASAPPDKRNPPVVIGHGLAIEISDPRPMSQPLSFTVVGRRGSCTSTASAVVAISGGGGWQEAVKLDGCRGDPAEQRLALMGSVADARWLEPKETMTADGAPIPTSGFFEGSLDGKVIEKKAAFPGLELSFEQRYREPTKDAVATRVVSGEKVLSAYYADLDGALKAGSRWLFVMVTSDGQRSVMELQADLLLPRLGAAPRSAPLTDELPAVAPSPPSSLASRPPAELEGIVRASRAPDRNAKGGLFLVSSLSQESKRVSVELTDDKGKTHPLELHWPEGLVPPFAKGQRIRVQSTRAGGRSPRFGVVCSSEDGRLLLAVDADKVQDWKIERGESLSKEDAAERTTEKFAVRIGHGDVTVSAKDGWTKMEVPDGTFYVYGTSATAKMKRGKRPPPDFSAGWLDYAIVRAR